jgi:hypothetical protein
MQKNVSGQKVIIHVYDSAGALKPGDAANLTVYVAKDGGTPTALTDTTATELSSANAPGAYILDLTQSETNADMLLFTGKSTTPGVSVDPQLIRPYPANFTALGISAGGVVSDPAGVTSLLGRLTATRAGYLDNLSALPSSNADMQTLLGRLTEARAGYLDVLNGIVASIAAQVQAGIINESDGNAVLAAIVAKIAELNPSLDELTPAVIAAGVRIELAPELARIDATISSRLAAASYTAPNNGGIVAIKERTDRLPDDPAGVSDLPEGGGGGGDGLPSDLRIKLEAAADRVLAVPGDDSPIDIIPASENPLISHVGVSVWNADGTPAANFPLTFFPIAAPRGLFVIRDKITFRTNENGRLERDGNEYISLVRGCVFQVTSQDLRLSKSFTTDEPAINLELRLG